jgi:hypothetical protein
MNRTSAIVRGSAAFAAAMLAGSAFAGTTSGILSINASGSYKLNAVTDADTFVANVNIADMASNAVGAQFRIVYDTTKVDLVGAAAGDDFPLVIYSNTSTAGVVTMATGVYGGATGATSGNIAKLTFRPKGVLCASDFGVGFATSGFTNKISDSSGTSLSFSTAANAAVNSLGSFSISGAPISVSGKACDAGALSAVVAAVSGAAPAASDSCGTGLNVVLKVNGSPAAMPSTFPIGTTTLEWVASDAAGNSASETRTVQVDDRQILTVSAALAGTIAGDRAHDLKLFYSGGPQNGQTASVVMGTNPGSVDVSIAPAITSSPACASAKELTHTLRNTAAGFTLSGIKWAVNFGALELGDSNDDNLKDILDFGMYVGDFTNSSVARDARSNFDGDTDIDTADYTFISSGFFNIGQSCASAWHPAPMAAVTLKQLRRMGMGDLAVADINRDGRIDSADIVAFMQGQRGGEATRNAGAGNAAE